MKGLVLRNPWIFLGLIIGIIGLNFIAFSQIPLNLDDWAYSSGAITLLISFNDTNIELYQTIWHSDTFIIEQHSYSNYFVIEISSPSNWLKTLLNDKKPLDVEFNLGIDLDPSSLKETINFTIYPYDFFKEVKNETYSYEETDSCFLSFTARGFKNEKIIPNIRILISIDLEKMTTLNLTQLNSSPQIHIFYYLALLRKTSMEALKPQGIVLILIGYPMLIVGNLKKKNKEMPVKWYILLVIAFSLLAFGNVLLHYAWYRIANMRVWWMLDSPINMLPAPKPFWSKGPWSWMKFSSELHPRPVPDPERGYTVSYIISLFILSYVASFMLLIGLVLLSICFMWMRIATAYADTNK